jgi:hypothetical protein
MWGFFIERKEQHYNMQPNFPKPRMSPGAKFVYLVCVGIGIAFCIWLTVATWPYNFVGAMMHAIPTSHVSSAHAAAWYCSFLPFLCKP